MEHHPQELYDLMDAANAARQAGCTEVEIANAVGHVPTPQAAVTEPPHPAPPRAANAR